ncbi:MAG: CFI-box-CTERM domain-containing protein [Saccharofermentanales bacterium]
MKPLTCEMCSSNDLIKQDSVYVCQNCGTKYSVEEAKKLMIEGTVEITGTVKIDNSEMIEKYRSIMMQSFRDKNYSDATSYANKILEINTENIDGVFYLGLSRSYLSTESNVYNELPAISGLKRAVNLLTSSSSSETVKCSKLIEYCSEMYNFAEYLNNKALAFIRVKYANSSARDVESEAKITIELRSYYAKSMYILYESSEVLNDSIIEKSDARNLKIKILELLRNYSDYVSKAHLGFLGIKFQPPQGKQTEDALQYNSYAVSILSKFSPSSLEPPNSGSCYIASCVYGSYDCPQVWALRRYRDNTLAKTWYGRAFIHIYYAISPTLVKWFGDKKWFKDMWKSKLSRMVAKLKTEGVEDTPYEDRNV